jgi:hypothetical protein
LQASRKRCLQPRLQAAFGLVVHSACLQALICFAHSAGQALAYAVAPLMTPVSTSVAINENTMRPIICCFSLSDPLRIDR